MAEERLTVVAAARLAVGAEQGLAEGTNGHE